MPYFFSDSKEFPIFLFIWARTVQVDSLFHLHRILFFCCFLSVVVEMLILFIFTTTATKNIHIKYKNDINMPKSSNLIFSASFPEWNNIFMIIINVIYRNIRSCHDKTKRSERPNTRRKNVNKTHWIEPFAIRSIGEWLDENKNIMIPFSNH